MINYKVDKSQLFCCCCCAFRWLFSHLQPEPGSTLLNSSSSSSSSSKSYHPFFLYFLPFPSSLTINPILLLRASSNQHENLSQVCIFATFELFFFCLFSFVAHTARIIHQILT